MKISKEKAHDAVNYLNSHGRPLDKELLKYLLGLSHNNDHVIEELKKFQNEDGGFGKCLEPDVRYPNSSALASSMALKIFQEIEADHNVSELQKLISYFIESFDSQKMRWRIVPDEIQDHPRAPWWRSEDIVESFRGCFANPRAEIASGLLDYPQLLDEEFLTKLIDSIVDYFLDESNEVTMHDLICYQTLFDSDLFLKKDKIADRFKDIILNVTETDPSKWNTYCLKPLWIASSPSSFAYKMIPEAIDRSLEYEINEFEKNGYWQPNWSWGESFPGEWEKAKKEWASYLVVKNFRIFIKFDKIQNF